jgi:lycopene cyclase CruP
MEQLGDAVLKPFLQDVVQFLPLSQTMLRVSLAHPVLVAKVIPQVGISVLLDWLRHFVMLAIYTGLYFAGKAFRSQLFQLSQLSQLPAAQFYRFDRWLNAWQYGSGQDYSKHTNY